jgi:hypothetical protein
VREHVGRRVDTHDLDVGRIGVERDARSDAYFKHLLVRPQVELFNCFVFVVDENSTEGMVVKTGQVGVDTALMRFAQRLNLKPLCEMHRAYPNAVRALRHAPKLSPPVR